MVEELYSPFRPYDDCNRNKSIAIREIEPACTYPIYILYIACTCPIIRIWPNPIAIWASCGTCTRTAVRHLAHTNYSELEQHLVTSTGTGARTGAASGHLVASIGTRAAMHHVVIVLHCINLQSRKPQSQQGVVLHCKNAKTVILHYKSTMCGI